ncbi:hypothetical protein [uncultured Bacteroides sp.]|uniref:hypothetical protein n=1 Tax=uncultured Bacteroides sp. TaxID=162156 RepID=UPI002676B770|nr:hypothetical protein [uncultured Bacteroides sp.]
MEKSVSGGDGMTGYKGCRLEGIGDVFPVSDEGGCGVFPAFRKKAGKMGGYFWGNK